MRLLDTCFLIHLQREWVRKRPGPATHYLERHAGEEFGVSVIAALEFLEGYQNPADGERFLDPFPQNRMNRVPDCCRTTNFTNFHEWLGLCYAPFWRKTICVICHKGHKSHKGEGCGTVDFVHLVPFVANGMIAPWPVPPAPVFGGATCDRRHDLTPWINWRAKIALPIERLRVFFVYAHQDHHAGD